MDICVAFIAVNVTLIYISDVSGYFLAVYLQIIFLPRRPLLQDYFRKLFAKNSIFSSEISAYFKHNIWGII